MTNHLPQDVSKKIKTAIYKAAEETKYVAMSRTDSGQFIDNLVKRKDIGGVLEDYISKQQVRHYIKDGMLNRYSKDKVAGSFPDNFESLVAKVFGFKVSKSASKSGVSLFRDQQTPTDGRFVVVATGTFLKWETALRKALCFVAANPFSKTAKIVQILLVLYAQEKVVPPADKALLTNALSICGAKSYIVGE